MVSYKKCFQSEDEIERMLQESGSEDDSVFSESENNSQSESESESESEDNSGESVTENSEASDSDETAPPASKRTKGRVGSGL
jgi:hypothetical protein